MAKKSKTVRLSDEAMVILNNLAKKMERSEGYIIDKLILGSSKMFGKAKNKA